MKNEDILKQMVKDNMILTVIDPSTYEEVKCHVEGGDGDYDLVSEDAMAPSEEDLENDPFAEPTGFLLQIHKLIVHGSTEMFFICGHDRAVYEVASIE